MTLESSKTLGGIGAILLFISVIPVIQYLWVIGLVGIALILVALHGLSNYYNAKGIFHNALYGIVAGIVGIVTAVGVAITAVLVNLSNIKDFISTLYPGWNGDWSTLSGLTPDTTNITSTDVLPFITGIILVVIVVLAVIWIFAIISAFFVRRSLKEVSEKSNVGSFGTAGLLLLIGAFLIILFGLGLLLMWIAALILAIAFFNLKPHEQPTATATSPPPPPVV
jgi:uncharacterized membrane protein